MPEGVTLKICDNLLNSSLRDEFCLMVVSECKSGEKAIVLIRSTRHFLPISREDYSEIKRPLRLYDVIMKRNLQN